MCYELVLVIGLICVLCILLQDSSIFILLGYWCQRQEACDQDTEGYLYGVS